MTDLETVEIVVPSVGESINEVFIGDWYVGKGEYVAADQRVVGLETDKATFDVPASVGGIVSRIVKQVGETAEIGEVIGFLIPADAPASEPQQAPSSAPSAAPPSIAAGASSPDVMPAAERLMHENSIRSEIPGSGLGGRVLKEDVQRRVSGSAQQAAMSGARETKSVPLSPIRQTIARRLVEAQQTAALLTTFNEIDLLRVKELRAAYKDEFLKKYGIKLGFMSFFVKAACRALQEFPQVNAQMDDGKLTYHNYCDIGIAVGGGKGLVVPVLRNAEYMSFAQVELAINDFGARAKENAIGLDELEGGTFTITNGGVYGSLLSTPIVNPPQSGVLGMHGIFDRPVAINGEVVIRPMMYVALTYDHRVVDGREAVTFLKTIKDQLEDPTRLILEI